VSDLAILCVTNGQPHAPEFLLHHERLTRELGARFIVAIDGSHPPGGWPALFAHEVIRVQSNGCIESVLDEAVSACPDGYILRLDDDEKVTRAMRDWLSDGEYRKADHWAFPRLHLYPDADHYVTTAPLYPDVQTRLSLKRFSGGRARVGTVAPVAIEHHKFLCRPLEDRRRLVERYEALQSGAGADFRVFSLPEDFDGTLAWERVEEAS
jgi:hypothetical protein